MNKKVVPNILLINDSNTFHEHIKFIFKNEKFNLTYVSSKSEAFSILNNKIVDIIMIDDSIGRDESLATLKEIKKNQDTKDISVIMISECKSEKNCNEFLDSGAAFYLKKPYYPTEISAKVHFELYMKHGSNYVK